jgi:iron transport multicopper oxidase
VPPSLNPNSTGWLVYDQAKPTPGPAYVDNFAPFNDYYLVPFDKEPLLDTVDQSIELDFHMDVLGDGAN